jgi:Ca2+-binding RTX toxin-like protein
LALLDANGQATVDVSAVGVGTAALKAVLRSGSFPASTSAAVAVTVSPASTTVALAPSVNPAVTGQAVTFTVTVAAVAPGAGTPTGTVTFKDGTVVLGTFAVGPDGTATFTTSFAAAGGHVITAVYSGDANFLGSSQALTEQVNAATPAITATYSAATGVLTVTGDAQDNTIVVSRDAAGNILVNNGAVAIQGGPATIFNTVLIQISGLGGNDNLSLNETNGASPRAIIDGGAGNDILSGGRGNDTLVGGAGNDTYRFDADLALGSDTIDESGGGVDTLDFSATTTRAVSVDLSNPAAQVVNAGLTLTLSSGATVENVIGGALGDTLTGNALDNSLSGGAGNDVLTGGAGNDLLVGGAGNDTYRFDADLALGSDTIGESGGGVDTLDFSATTTRSITVNLGLAGAQVVNAGLTLTLSSGSTIENAIGGALADSLIGNALNNMLSGGAGNDTLDGGAGTDTLDGGAGTDVGTNGEVLVNIP